MTFDENLHCYLNEEGEKIHAKLSFSYSSCAGDWEEITLCNFTEMRVEVNSVNCFGGMSFSSGEIKFLEKSLYFKFEDTKGLIEAHEYLLKAYLRFVERRSYES
jgi:hypothetical protein